MSRPPSVPVACMAALLVLAALALAICPAPGTCQEPPDPVLALEPGGVPEPWTALAPLLLQHASEQGVEPACVLRVLGDPRLVHDPGPLRDKLHGLFDTTFGERRIRRLQQDLEALGLDPGPVDGAYGAATRDAILAYEREQGLRMDGLPLHQLAARVHAAVDEADGRAPVSCDPALNGSGAVYRAVMKPERLSEGLQFYIEHRALLRRMQAEYGVPGEVAAGIVTVETRAGRYLGVSPALASLASLALGMDQARVRALFEDTELLPEQEAWLRETAQARARWALAEAAALLRHAQLAGVDPLDLPGSLYGAVGISQFMPSSVLQWGVDGDQDGRVDLFTVDDAVMSLANYLGAHGWRSGDAAQDETEQRRALYGYNHSTRYVNTVLAVARHVRRAEVDAPPEPADDPDRDVVEVADAAALLAAVGPGRRLELAPGEYPLLQAALASDNPHVRVAQHQEGARWVEFVDVNGLALTAEQGATVAGGLAFVASNGLVLDNLVLVGDNATQDRSPVLQLDQCGSVHCRDVAVLGEGCPGLAARDSNNVTLCNVNVSRCQGRALTLVRCREVLAANILFVANAGERMIDADHCAGVEFISCVLRDNAYGRGHLLHLDPGTGVALLETFVGGNAALGLTNVEHGLTLDGVESASNAFGP